MSVTDLSVFKAKKEQEQAQTEETADGYDFKPVEEANRKKAERLAEQRRSSNNGIKRSHNLRKK